MYVEIHIRIHLHTGINVQIDKKNDLIIMYIVCWPVVAQSSGGTMNLAYICIPVLM